MATITISEALNWQKQLRERHSELVGLRNQNSASELRYIGANAEKLVVKTPLYDVKKLDRMIEVVAKEVRVLDNAIKKTNATVAVVGYEQNDAVLGVLE